MFFSPLLNKARGMPLVFWGSDGSCEFVFNLGLSKEHAGFSPKIGSCECRERERGGRGSKRRGKEEEEEEGTLVMSTRCLTFAGSHILWSFGWCMISS